MTEWMAFYQIEPFGTEVDMLGHAITSSTIANANRPKGKREYKPSDFMPDFEKESRPKTIDGLINFVKQVTEIMNGSRKNNGNHS